MAGDPQPYRLAGRDRFVTASPGPSGRMNAHERTYDCGDPAQQLAGGPAGGTSRRCAAASWWFMPTDTVYGLAGRRVFPGGGGRFWPPRGGAGTAAPGAGRHRPSGHSTDRGARRIGQDLVDEFWPGGLTLVFIVQPTLIWDLGDTKGTVAVRMRCTRLPFALLGDRPPGGERRELLRPATGHHRRRGRRAARRERPDARAQTLQRVSRQSVRCGRHCHDLYRRQFDGGRHVHHQDYQGRQTGCLR